MLCTDAQVGLCQRSLMDVVITPPNGTVILQQVASAADTANTRSLYGIIWSCLVTLFFCTWVAIHPNSADENETDGVVVVRRIGLMIAMFLVPEMVVCWALRQWVLATYLGKKYKGYPVEVKWRKVHGYFLIMGGFMYYDKDGKLQRLTSSKLKKLYDNREVEWPTVSAKQIRDRSKADVLSKLVVLVQTGWFSLQLLVRLGKGMVVTELEISTFAFAVVNLIVYILWWDKPFDVRSHVVVRGGKEPDITLKPIPVQPPTTRTASSPSLDPSALRKANTPDDDEKVEHEQSTLIILANDLSQRISNSGQRFSRKMKRAFRIITPCLPHTDPESQDEPKKHRKINWRRYIAIKAEHIFTTLWKSRPHGFMDILYLYPAFLYGCFISPFYNLYVEKGRTVEALSEKDPYDASVDPEARSRHPWAGFLFDYHAQLAVVSAVGVIFGSVHLIAWPFQFHTDAERWLWRASSLALIFPPILFQVYTFLFFLCRNKFPNVSSWVKDLMTVFWILTLLLAVVAYMIGRALLIVLPLMALRHAPKGAFVDIDWASHFPHI